MSISQRMRELIDRKNLTPYIVSAATGISQATLSRILNNATARPTQKNIETLAEYFNVNPTWLTSGEGNMLRDGSSPTEPIDPIVNRLLLLIESQQRTIENMSSKK